MASCRRTRRSTFFFFFFVISVFALLSSPGPIDGARDAKQWPSLRRAGHRVDESASATVGLAAAGICVSVVIPNGYKCQEFNLKTQDGYILAVQRITDGGRGGRSAAAAGEGRQPVLLQHGVLVDGLTWLLNSPRQSLAYILADRGFDVWIANTRGTRWSRRHVALDPSSPAFWSWSWDELVAYELPAICDFVYARTGRKMDYVGHSMGTLTALAAFSERRLVDKLRSAALLSPVAYLTHVTTPLGILAARAFLDKMFTWLGIAEFDPHGLPVTNLLKVLCLDPSVDCYSLMTAFTAFREGNLAKFDYGGADANVMHYGEARPPAYNLSNIPGDLPLFLSYGGRDRLSDAGDVRLLLADLRRSHGDGKLTVRYVPDYAHADFVMGTTAREVVYDAVIAFFNSHT